MLTQEQIDDINNGGMVQDHIRNGLIDDLSIFSDDIISGMLTSACVCGFTHFVMMCIEYNVDVSRDEFDIHSAAYYGYFDIVKLLIENGANPLAMDGTTSYVSRCRSHYKVADYLDNIIKVRDRTKKIDKILNIIKNETYVNTRTD